eukprot:349842-Chlamydomonas_euryale.AAC.1
MHAHVPPPPHTHVWKGAWKLAWATMHADAPPPTHTHTHTLLECSWRVKGFSAMHMHQKSTKVCCLTRFPACGQEPTAAEPPNGTWQMHEQPRGEMHNV